MKTWVTSLYNLHNYKKYVFCSTLSESENFLLCVKTKRQADFKYFKRFGAFKGFLEQKKTLHSTRSCVNWPTHAIKSPIYTRTR
jgi:hypothetical protein